MNRICEISEDGPRTHGLAHEFHEAKIYQSLTILMIYH
jgi:hypothetical protein